ncbi:uncharacterized protein BJX67DRAFT_354443 [Aspergillus lucknowensis]|uniref:Uncharacterized protein n=1 Tax=Aspergillus lucknowensis TaxID=176173 RepID=A0ABR4LQZ5_9EURO
MWYNQGIYPSISHRHRSSVLPHRRSCDVPPHGIPHGVPRHCSPSVHVPRSLHQQHQSPTLPLQQPVSSQSHHPSSPSSPCTRRRTRGHTHPHTRESGSHEAGTQEAGPRHNNHHRRGSVRRRRGFQRGASTPRGLWLFLRRRRDARWAPTLAPSRRGAEVGDTEEVVEGEGESRRATRGVPRKGDGRSRDVLHKEDARKEDGARMGGRMVAVRRHSSRPTLRNRTW